MSDELDVSMLKDANREVEVAHVIITRNQRRGVGTIENPVRIVTVWRMDGTLIAETDPMVNR